MFKKPVKFLPAKIILKIAFHVIFVFVAGMGVCVGADAGQVLPAKDWIPIIEEEERNDAISNDEAFKLVRVGAGIVIANHPGSKSNFKGALTINAVDAFNGFWVEGEGVFRKWLAGGSLEEGKKRYEPIFHGLLYRAALDKNNNVDSRIFVLPLSADELSLAVARRAAAMTRGHETMLKSYRGESLSRADVDALRLCRLAYQTQTVGEYILPWHWGLHRAAPAIVNPNNPSKPKGARPILVKDFPVHRFEDVMGWPTYSDIADYAGQYSFPFRPAGVLEYLRILAAFVPAATEEGKPVCELSPQFFDFEKAKGGGTVSVFPGRERKRSLVLVTNDPTDCVTPLQKFMEPVWRAYRDYADFAFVTANIHDYFMKSPVDFFTPSELYGGPPPGGLTGHAITTEEFARTLKGRLIESPFSSMPCYLDTQGQTGKNELIVGGGANFYRVLLPDGTVASMGGDCGETPVGIINGIEHSLQRLLAGDVVPVPTQGLWDVGSIPNLRTSTNRSLVIEGTAENIGEKGFDLKTKSDGAGLVLKIKTGAFTRIDNGIKRMDVTAIKPAAKVRVLVWQDDLFGSGSCLTGNETLKAPQKLTIQSTSGAGGDFANMSYPPRYATLWNMVSLKGITECAASRVSCSTATLSATFGDVWLCGTVVRVDAATRRITIRQDLPKPEEMPGYAAWLRQKDAMRLPSDNQKKMEMVSWWLEKPEAGRMYEIFADDFTAITVNGLFGGKFDQIKPGDRIGAQFHVDNYMEPVIPADMVRISKRIPFEKK